MNESLNTITCFAVGLCFLDERVFFFLGVGDFSYLMMLSKIVLGSFEAESPDLSSICYSVRMSAAPGLRRASSQLENLEEIGDESLSKVLS